MTFTDWLRPKRTAYAAIAMVIAVTGVLAAAVAQWFALVIGAQVAGTGGPVQAAYDAAHAMLWLAWVLPLALPALLVVPVLLFEALAWVVRVDSADDAWTSLAWLARAWRGWGAWMLGVIATTAVAGFVLWRIDGIEGAILALVVPWAAAVLSPLVFWNARNVAAVRAQAAWRPGWPGLRTLSFVVACIAAGIAVSMVVGRLEAPGFVVWPVLLVLQVASFAATAICVALWLDRGRAPLAVAARVRCIRACCCRWRCRSRGWYCSCCSRSRRCCQSRSS